MTMTNSYLNTLIALHIDKVIGCNPFEFIWHKRFNERNEVPDYWKRLDATHKEMIILANESLKEETWMK